jgi:hypothetical protein
MNDNRSETAIRGGAELPFTDSPDDAILGAEISDQEAFFAAAGQPAAVKDDKASTDLPGIVLAVAGLSVFDSIIVVVFLSLWAVNPEAMLAIIQTLAGISLLLAVAPIVIGGLVLHTNKQSGTVMPGTPWAGVGMLVGIILAGLTLLIPLLSAVRLLMGGPLDPIN